MCFVGEVRRVMKTVLIVGDSKQAFGVAKAIKRHISTTYAEINVEDYTSFKTIQSAKTLIFVLPAYKEPYQHFRKLVLNLKEQGLNHKEIVFISTNGSAVHHGIMQMWVREIGCLRASASFPDNNLCLKPNGELLMTEKIRKKLLPVVHQLQKNNQAKIIS